jgi:cysteine sulfinate desulfinase/cysteine desulfurase-like protein
LKAIGADGRTSIRFSFGRWTKKSDLDKALAAIEKSIEIRLR